MVRNVLVLRHMARQCDAGYLKNRSTYYSYCEQSCACHFISSWWHPLARSTNQGSFCLVAFQVFYRNRRWIFEWSVHNVCVKEIVLRGQRWNGVATCSDILKAGFAWADLIVKKQMMNYYEGFWSLVAWAHWSDIIWIVISKSTDVLWTTLLVVPLCFTTPKPLKGKKNNMCHPGTLEFFYAASSMPMLYGSELSQRISMLLHFSHACLYP